MLLDVNVPSYVVVEDYHQLFSLRHYYSSLVKGLKVKELGFSEVLNGYLGFVYAGNLEEEANKNYMHKLISDYLSE